MRARSDRTPRARAANFSAPARRVCRVAGSLTAVRRWAAGRARTSLQPGREKSRLLERMRIRSGRVSAMTWAPLAAATSEACSCCS